MFFSHNFHCKYFFFHFNHLSLYLIVILCHEQFFFNIYRQFENISRKQISVSWKQSSGKGFTVSYYLISMPTWSSCHYRESLGIYSFFEKCFVSVDCAYSDNKENKSVSQGFKSTVKSPGTFSFFFTDDQWDEWKRMTNEEPSSLRG